MEYLLFFFYMNLLRHKDKGCFEQINFPSVLKRIEELYISPATELEIGTGEIFGSRSFSEK